MSVPAFVMPTGPMRPKRMRSRVDMLSFDDVWIGPTSNTLFSNEIDRIPPAASDINFDFCVDGSAFLPIFAALATCAAFLQSRFVTTKNKTPKRGDNDGEMVASSITDEPPAIFPSTITLSDDKPRNVARNALAAGIQTDKFQRRSFDAQLLLPGGGVFLFWQIGVLSVLKQQFDLSRVVMTGASAGAIAATLTAAGVDHDEFVRLCLQTCDDMKLWTRRLGLIGKMGSLMERVLHQLLPQDTADRLRDHNISMILTPFGSTEVVRIHNFRTKQCVMDAVMASAHIPLLLNKRLMAHFDGQAYIDGSFFAKHQDFVRNDIRAPIIALDHMDDPSMQDKTLLDCIRITSKADAWDMYQSGRSHAKAMMERGDLGCLTKKAALTQPSRQRMRIESHGLKEGEPRQGLEAPTAHHASPINHVWRAFVGTDVLRTFTVENVKSVNGKFISYLGGAHYRLGPQEMPCDRGWTFVKVNDDNTQEVCDAFHKDGFVCIGSSSGLLLTENELKEWNDWSEEYFSRCFRILHDNGHTAFPSHFSSQEEKYALGSGGVKNGFREIVMRSPGRYELSLLDMYQLSDSNNNHNNNNNDNNNNNSNSSSGSEMRGPSVERLMVDSVLSKILPALFRVPSLQALKVCHVSLLVSTPGAPEQAWHADGGHVNATQHLPCHVLNVFVPLVGLTADRGPTEFRPASHRLTRDLTRLMLLAKARKTLQAPVTPLPQPGEAILFDYRILHRGKANASNTNRTILVLTFAQPWFVDVVNFPKNSMYHQKELKTKG